MAIGGEAIKMLFAMIAQQELQHLLSLPDHEKLLLAHQLLESLILGKESRSGGPRPLATEESANSLKDYSPSAEWLVSQAIPRTESTVPDTHEEKIPFLSLAGIFSGGAGDSGERADEICHTEIKQRSGFTLKEKLPEQ
ncbi:MAG: hypothetical protein SF339_16845 [Blastocatellia bacterium]|nr:hypothetical protein [Blastocatellia bacterium]